MGNKYKYTVKFLFVNDNESIFSNNYYSYKYYHYNTFSELFYVLNYDLKDDFVNCIEMQVIKNMEI